MRDIAICLAVLMLLAGCGSSHRRSGPQSTSPQEQQQGTGGVGRALGGAMGAPSQLVAEVPYPQTAADCARQLEAQARAAGVRVTVRETRPKNQGFSCIGDVQR